MCKNYDHFLPVKVMVIISTTSGFRKTNFEIKSLPGGHFESMANNKSSGSINSGVRNNNIMSTMFFKKFETIPISCRDILGTGTGTLNTNSGTQNKNGLSMAQTKHGTPSDE